MNRFFAMFLAVVFWLGLGFQASASTPLATPLVDSGWLADNLGNDSIRIIDLRNSIDGGDFEAWKRGHIPGSVHSDYLLENWRVTRNGITNLLPTGEQFRSLARRIGISHDTHVVLVPAGVSSNDFGTAASAYWTFKVFGHDNVSILDGGFRAWQAAFPGRIETGEGAGYPHGDFTPRFDSRHYITADDVVPLVGRDDDAVLVAARTPDEFWGMAQHPDAKLPGRIPGALGIYQDISFDAKSGRLKPKEELAWLYEEVDPSKQVVSYCNTGHWAAVNWFVLSEILGHENVRVYDGSMIEWTTENGRPLQGPTNLDRIRGFAKDLLG